MSEKYLTVRSGVLIPLLQALVTGLVFGGGVSAVGAVMNWFGFDRVVWWQLGLAAFFLATIRAWIALIDEWRGFLYPNRKQDPIYVETDPQTVRVEIAQNRGRNVQFMDLPADASQMIMLGQGIVEGLGFTEAQWTGKGQPFTRNQFVQLRGEMIKRGLVVWNSDRDPARGLRVTGKGMAVMRYFASQVDSPTLRIEDR